MKYLIKQLVTGIFVVSAIIACNQRATDSETYFKLPALVGDNMVLQQNSEVNIWGWAKSRQKIKIQTTWDNKTYSTKADKMGNWKLQVETIQAGGPYEIIIKTDSIVLLTNIMLGEVWVCSGQSNMEWPLSRAESAETEIPIANYSNIRLFTVQKTISRYPLSDVNGQWVVCTPETVSGFSAVGYFFGKNIHEKMNVPFGLINTSWGGTVSEAWTSEETLLQYEYFRAKFEEVKQDPFYELENETAYRISDSIKNVITQQSDLEHMESIGKIQRWMDDTSDIAEWGEIQCPGEWSTIPEIGMLEGVMWLRKDVKVPASWIGKELAIDLGPVDELNETWVNGQRIGLNDSIENWNKDCSYTVPRELVKDENLTISIRAVNTVAEGGLTGKPEQLKI